jgi:hypothetical protein
MTRNTKQRLDDALPWVVLVGAMAAVVLMSVFALDDAEEARARRKAKQDAFIEKCESMGGIHVTHHTGFGGFGSLNDDCRFPPKERP